MQGAPVSSWLPTSKETLIRPYTVKSNGLWGAGGCLTSEGTAGPVGVGFCGGFADSGGFSDCARARPATARHDRQKATYAKRNRMDSSWFEAMVRTRRTIASNRSEEHTSELQSPCN